MSLHATIGRELADEGTVFALDVRDEEAVAATMAQVVVRFGRLAM